MTPAQIAAAVTERETRLAAVMRQYGLADVNVPPFLACTARDLAGALDKLERKVA